MKTLIAISTALTLAACGGGSSSSPISSASAAPAPQAAQASCPVPPVITSITFMGDSTAFGIGAPANLSEAAAVQQLTQITTINKGVSGSTAAQALTGTLSYTTTLAQQLVNDPSQIVVMNWTINDSHTVDLNTFNQNLFDLVATVRAAGKIPVFEEANPGSIAGYDTALPPYVAAMDAAAATLHVPLIKQYGAFLAIPGWQSLLADGLHPNEFGYSVKAYATAAIIRAIQNGYGVQ